MAHIVAVIVHQTNFETTCEGVYASEEDALPALKAALIAKKRAELVYAQEYINDLLDSRERKGKYRPSGNSGGAWKD